MVSKEEISDAILTLPIPVVLTIPPIRALSCHLASVQLGAIMRDIIS